MIIGLMDNDNGISWVFKGIAVLFVLAGIAIFFKILFYSGNVISFSLGNSLGNIVGFVIFIWIAFWICSWMFRPYCWSGRRRGRRAKEILKSRYARGDISKKEMEHMMDDVDRF